MNKKNNYVIGNKAINQIWISNGFDDDWGDEITEEIEKVDICIHKWIPLFTHIVCERCGKQKTESDNYISTTYGE